MKTQDVMKKLEEMNRKLDRLPTAELWLSVGVMVCLFCVAVLAARILCPAP